MDRINLFFSDEYEPWFNLAVEDWIFTEMDPSVPTLFLWRNRDTVVIGRYQNPWTECRIGEMERDNVYLARRQTGGGAVYHDLNNTNFTFLAGLDVYDPQVGFGMISRALEKFGIESKVSGRNDMIIERGEEVRKFSGSAFRKLNDRAFHHGTLLINSDLTRLNNYLTPHPGKLEAKGVKSVRSRVVNLAELNSAVNHDVLCDGISREFEKTFGCTADRTVISRDFMEKQPGFMPLYDKLRSPEWLYGKTPPFTHRLEGRLDMGQMEILLDVKQGIIQSGIIYSDSLHSDLVGELQGLFTDLPYGRDSIRTAIEGLFPGFPDKKGLLQNLSEFIIGEIE
ncbi:MAG: lipoate--protein ligase [Spirochaetales bacterium]|nr:lipoate--protein ligase [Spirochaetales bacterium]